MVDIDNDDRDRGILTTRDRQFLRGEKDVTDGTAVNIRVDIRNRIKHALADFELLVYNLPRGDRKQLFKVTGQSNREEFLADGVVARNSNRGAGWLEQVVIFVYMVCRDWGLDFEALVERAVRRAETTVWLDGQFDRQEDVYDAEVTVDFRQDQEVDVGRAKERFENDEYVTNAEIGALVREGAIDPNELQLFQDEDWSMPGPDENPDET